MVASFSLGVSNLLRHHLLNQFHQFFTFEGLHDAGRCTVDIDVVNAQSTAHSVCAARRHNDG